MFHATLITGGTALERLEKAEKLAGVKLEASQDILIVEPNPSVTIGQVRSLEKFLSRKPLVLEKNICLLTNATALTLPAQNAFLKTLEEPPESALIILLANSTAKLLPTVTSRCQIISIKSEAKTDLKEQEKIFNNIANASVGERITLAATFAADAKSFCLNQLNYLRQMRTDKLKLMKMLNQSLKYLDANVNPKLTLEHLFLNW